MVSYRLGNIRNKRSIKVLVAESLWMVVNMSVLATPKSKSVKKMGLSLTSVTATTIKSAISQAWRKSRRFQSNRLTLGFQQTCLQEWNQLRGMIPVVSDTKEVQIKIFESIWYQLWLRAWQQIANAIALYQKRINGWRFPKGNYWPSWYGNGCSFGNAWTPATQAQVILHNLRKL